MVTVSGDHWSPGKHSPYINAVEYFNYTNRDITLVDNLGCETELLRRKEDPFDAGDRGFIIVRVTRLVDPRRVAVADNRASHEVDRLFLDEFQRQVEAKRGNITEGTSGYNQCRLTIQIDIRLEPKGSKINYKSDLLGITIRESEDYNAKTFVATPEGYIRNVMIPELAELDRLDDGDVDKGIRTIMSARLVDNDKRVGTLWTMMYGTATKVEPVIDKGQKEGLYLAGGHNLSIKQFIPLEELLDVKLLMKHGLFSSELECKKNSTGDYTTTVITERDKIKKENRSLRDENTKLSNKVTTMEMDAKAEKINKAHNDYKHTRSYDNMKDYYDNNTLASAGRLVDKALVIIKSGITLITMFNMIKAFI